MIENKAKTLILNSIDLFEGLTSNQKLIIQDSIIEKKYSKKDFVFNSGDKIDRVFFVKQGRIKIIKKVSNDKESIKRVLVKGDYFGEYSALDPERFGFFNDSAKVMDANTIIFTIPTLVFKQICDDYDFIFQKVIKNMLANCARLDSRLDSVMLKKSKMRIVDFIKELAEDIGKPVGYDILIKHNLTHQEIANVTGISRQKVTTILNEFKQDGLIHLERNSILVHDKRLFLQSQ